MKAFADEQGAINQYNKQNKVVYAFGKKKSIVWGFFMFGLKVFQSSAFAAILFIIGQYYYQENLTIGTVMAYLLYMQKIVQTFGELANHLLTVAKVQGASYKVAELIIKKSHIEITENGTIDKSNDGKIDLVDVKFAYPAKKDV